LSKIDPIPEGSSKTEVASGDGLQDTTTDEAPISPAERSLLQKIIRKGLVENKNDIEVQQKDPSSPLYSVKSFEELRL
jgi:ATP-dependent RNA helicase DDX19/DBP5